MTLKKVQICKLSGQSGAALVIALLMLIMLTLVGLASIFTSTFEIKLSGNKRGSTDAFYASDSGIQVTMANERNFNLPGKYHDNQYDPFTDPTNTNPTKAKVVITHMEGQRGSPRGCGYSAAHFTYHHYVIRSTGQDQTDVGLAKSTVTLEQKAVYPAPGSSEGGGLE